MLRLVCTGDGGRSLVAARDVAAGTVIFAEVAYCVSPCTTDAGATATVCVHCSQRVRRAFRVCEACGHAYCSAPCWAMHAHAHARHGECAVLRLVQCMRGAVPAEDVDMLQMVCLVLARCVSECATSDDGGGAATARLQRTHEACDTVVGGGDGALRVDPAVFCAAAQPHGVAARARYDHVECLTTNRARLDDDMVGDFVRLHALYERWRRRDVVRARVPEVDAALPRHVSCDVFVALCCAFLCNGFGVWDSRARRRATALFAQSAYFNHSCAPNVARRHVRGTRIQQFVTLRDVARGEALCIAYIDPRAHRALRQARLRATYAFDCTCTRCRNDGGDGADAEHECADLHFCTSCVYSILHPVRAAEERTGVTRWRCPLCDAYET